VGLINTVGAPLNIEDHLSPNFDAREDATPIDMLVIHYTGMQSGEEALARLTDIEWEVSAHYMIEENGRILRLVAEERRAWHAGVSYWRGHSNINARSIGIELVNPGHEFGYRPFPEAQMWALEILATDILSRYPIPRRNVVGHSDVAPTRKNDPGELFDWRSLAAKGIGHWPERASHGPANILDALAFIGYDIQDYALAVATFQRHFRPIEVHGVADLDTQCWLQGTVELCERVE
jgi:N-acetylmuramoyl-L-alanine amidase